MRVSPEDYDAAFKIAQRDRVNINDVIRRAIKKLIDDERGSLTL